MQSDEPTSTIDSSQALVGKVLEGKYRLDALVGSGAMGGVYAGMHLDLRKKVAIKVLHPWLAQDMRSCQRFLQEARAICSLSHPNVVAVDRCGKDGSCIYLAMEYLEGETLADRIRRQGKLSVDDAVYIVTEAASGLAHAHTQGILHRDVKPSNIMLGTAGSASVHVVDFGIAKFSHLEPEQQQNLTSTNGTVGTPYYMSPEQCSRQELDQRSDIYSLGCVLYEALTGEVPFRGDSAFAILLAHAQDQAPTLPKQVPMWLQSVVAKAMSKNREQRYQSMMQFRQALLDQQGAPNVVRKSRKKGKYKTAAIVTAACLLGAMGAFLGKFQYTSTRPEANLDQELKELEARKDWGHIAELYEKHLAAVPEGASGNAIRQTAIRHIGDKALDFWEHGKNAEANTLFLQMKRLCDDDKNDRGSQEKSWNYMSEMVENDLTLSHLTAARTDAQSFVDSTKLYLGLGSNMHALALAMMAEVEWYSQNLPAARKLFGEAVHIADTVTVHDGQNAMLRQGVFEHTLDHYFTVDPKGAELAAKRSLEFYLALKPVPMTVSKTYYALSASYGAQGKWAEAKAALQESISYLKGIPGGDFVAQSRIGALAGMARDQGASDVALALYSEAEEHAKLLGPLDRGAYAISAIGGRLLTLSRMKRYDERDKLYAQALLQVSDESSRGILSDLYGAMMSEGPDWKRAEVAVQADIDWDLKHHASAENMYDDYQRLASVKVRQGDNAAFLSAVKMMERSATNEMLQARFQAFKKSLALN